MIPKSNLGQTKKYSGVVKSVKEANTTQQIPEEPRITKEQVIEAFHAFGFEPGQRNHDDIAYWTTKPQSEGQKLIEELHQRRTEINNQQDETQKADFQNKKSQQDLLNKQNEAKSALPRLSDNEIAALFDEYGLPAPDPEWSRNHLPNDPQKIRSILEMQRKTADDMLKKHAKNTVNSVPEIPKNQPMPMQPSSMGGQGGPTPQSPMGMQGDMTQGEGPKTPFFIGDHSIVRIINPQNPNDSTIWLVDAKRKVLRPFASQKAFENAFDNPKEANDSATVISVKELGPGGALDGFTPLQGNKGIKDDGTMDKIDFSPSELKNRYGKPEDPTGENKSLSILDGVFNKLSSGNQQPQ
jgi:predicted Fe-S protein YdhL (DUF1289 family)